jgi:hypothetical protein
MINNVAVNVPIHFCVDVFSVLLDIHLAVELLDPMVTLYLIFLGTVKLFSKVAAPFPIPISKW